VFHGRDKSHFAVAAKELFGQFSGRFRLLCIFDDLFNLWVTAEEAISKWQCISAGAGTLLQAFTEIVDPNIDHATVLELFYQLRVRFHSRLGHGYLHFKVHRM
jgi:hypothetical protein